MVVHKEMEEGDSLQLVEFQERLDMNLLKQKKVNFLKKGFFFCWNANSDFGKTELSLQNSDSRGWVMARSEFDPRFFFFFFFWEF